MGGAASEPAVGCVAGGCLCGSVRFSVELPPRWVAHCHCSRCRRAHGAGFVTWVGIEQDRFRLLEGAERLKVYQSSADATRSFCGVCGSSLFFQSGNWPGEIHVTLASLDSPTGLEPQAHAYWGSRVAWADADWSALKTVDPSDHA